VFEGYPNEVIVYVSDPRTGVQRGCKWPPTIAEIVAACDRRQGELVKAERFKTWGQRNEPALLEGPKEERPTYEELIAKYGENFGLEKEQKREPERAPSWDSITSYYRHNPERMRELIRLTKGEDV